MHSLFESSRARAGWRYDLYQFTFLEIERLLIITHTECPLSLQSLCRLAVRRHCAFNALPKLAALGLLSPRLSDFVNFHQLHNSTSQLFDDNYAKIVSSVDKVLEKLFR